MEVSIIGGADGPTSIFLAGRIGSRFLIPAILIMILFYGIYFAKMIQQRRRGIRTDQLGRNASLRRRRFSLYRFSFYPSCRIGVFFRVASECRGL